MAHFEKNTTSSTLLGLDVKVHTPEAFHNKMRMTMMAQHHNHHHRPLSSSPFENDSYAAADDDGHGPTAYMSFTNHINLVSALAPPAPARLPLQPFDISPYTSPTTTFKSSAGGMAASLFPFTSAQWRELERQAMIYKYMMASVPVPPDLLNLIATSTSHSPCMDGGFNLRLASNSDPEPGRCRRTDGKKWRCSRDVAPNHKYCERHMHRGRPRSRKPVEVHTNIPTPTSINNNQQIKRARHESNPFPTPHVTVPVSHPTSRKDGSSSHFLASSNTQPFPESSLSLANFGVKSTNFDSVAPLTSNNKEPRGLDWMLNGDPISLGASDSEWQSLMHDKVGMSSESSCNTTEPQYLNSYALYSSGMDQHNRRHPFLLNPLLVPENLQREKPRGFIDAWSNSVTDEDNANTNTTNKNSAASIGKLSLSSLDLSMGGGAVHEDIGTTEMGLGNKHTDTKKTSQNWLNPAPWVASTPGGPLAEVLRSSTLTATNEAASNASSPATTHVESNSPLGTMVSSPSGVLPKTLGSLSDCSSNSSPRVASSRASSEMAFLRFQSNVN